MAAFDPLQTLGSKLEWRNDLSQLCPMRIVGLALLALVAGCQQSTKIPPEQDAQWAKDHPVGRWQAFTRADGSVWVMDTRSGSMAKCDIPKDATVAHCIKQGLVL